MRSNRWTRRAKRSSLKPVTFRYKHELDPESVPQFGLVAEQVEKVNPALVARDAEGKALHRALRGSERDVAQRVPQGAPQGRATGSDRIAEQDCKVQKLEATVAQLQSAFKAQAAQIREVSEQLELSGPALRTVVGNQ